MELHLAINLLMIAHYFTLEVPANYKLKIDPFPSLSVSKKLKFHVARTEARNTCVIRHTTSPRDPIPTPMKEGNQWSEF